MNVRNTNLLLLFVVGASSDVAAVEGEVDRLDDTARQFQRACAYPFLCIPERDERVTTASRQILAAG
ncbi:hypothetical protein IG631_15734 [Alternaria alternata]|nr:hypothetical protein IG631_15734 [Alternaria alternata]